MKIAPACTLLLSLPAFSRRAVVQTVAALAASNSQPARADDDELREGSLAPLRSRSFPCVNVKGKQQVALADYLSQGKYVVLWFLPEASLGMANRNNELEATNFQDALSAFAELDAVVLGCSAAPTDQQTLVDRKLLTLPFLSDPNRELIKAYGALSPIGPTFRNTFIIDPSGTVRFVERNVELGVGNFNLANHVARVQRELYKVRNTDGWEI